MGAKSAIEWTDATWPIVNGCTRVSPECDNCYAIRDSNRLGENPNPKIQHAYSGLTKHKEHGLDWSGEVRCLPERLTWPLNWRKPKKIFPANMGDLFHYKVPDKFIGAAFGVALRAHWHTYQFLTKRADRMFTWFEMVAKDPGGLFSYLLACMGVMNPETYKKPMGKEETEAIVKRGWPAPHIQIGVSIGDQPTANERLFWLMKLKRCYPHLIVFISYEPALGPVDLTHIDEDGDTRDVLRGELIAKESGCLVEDNGPSLDWVIAGGESGPGARPSHPDWFRQVRDQCQATGVPFFFKQWGSWRPGYSHNPRKQFVSYESGDSVHNVWMERVGKKTAGRLLDGKMWDQFPGVKVPCPR